MIDFTSTQLSWILIGACSVGGTGYMTMDNKINDMDKKIAIVQVKAESSDKRLQELSTQLDRVEQLLLAQNKRGSK
jgi:Trk-type K+ transport system membrane component